MLKKLTVACMVLLLLISPLPVSAANSLTWDNDYSRTRNTNDSIGQLYNAAPIAVSIGDALGTWLYSMSTPIVYGNTLYQYAYNTDSNIGYLVAVDVSTANPETAADFKVLWAARFPTSPGERVDGSPGPSISPDGQYMTIAVGNYIYSWPIKINGNPNVPDGNGQLQRVNSFPIYGNEGQTTNLIAMSPLITKKSYKWQGTDINTFEAVTFNAPVVAAGSWNGGFTAAPLHIPTNIDSNSVNWLNFTTTSKNPAWAGEIFTSSPAVQSDGYGDIIFGVDGGYPVLFVFSPSTWNIGYIGAGKIKYGIASPPVIDPQTGNIYVPDKFGNIYSFDNNGTYLSKNTSLSNGNLIISNIAVANNYIFAVKAGGSEVHAINKSTMSDVGTVFSGSNGFIDPAVVTDTSTGVSRVAVNDANGVIRIASYDSVDSGLFVSNGGLSTSAKGYAPPPYVSVLIAAGPNKFIVSWTNDAVAGGEEGALEFWVPQTANLNAYVNPATVYPNDQTTLYVDTTVDNNISTVLAWLLDSNGNPAPIGQATEMNYVTNYTKGGKTYYRWSLPFRAPGKPGSFTLPVELRYSVIGNTAASIEAAASYTVKPQPGGATTDQGGTLILKSFCWPENRLEQELQDASLGSKPLWSLNELRQQHPEGTTYMGDTILADLTVETPQISSGDRLVSATLTEATIERPLGYPDPDTEVPGSKWLVKTVDQDMAINGNLTATLQFEETWAGWKPGKYLADSPLGSYNSPTLKDGPDWDKGLTVYYNVLVKYKYPVEERSSEPDGNGGYTSTTYTVWYDAQANVPGSAFAPLASWGTDFVIVPITAAVSYW